MLSTRSERLTPSSRSQQREREQRRVPGRRPGRLCRRRDEREPAGSLSYFPWLPELDHVLFAHDGHLAPPLLVIGRSRVGRREVVVRRDDASDLVQRLAARLAGENFVLHSIAADALVLRGQTARPQDSSASRPASVMRAAVHGGSQTTLTRTSRTPSSSSRRSRTSSRMNSEAGHPIAVKVRSTWTTPSSSVMPYTTPRSTRFTGISGSWTSLRAAHRRSITSRFCGASCGTCGTPPGTSPPSPRCVDPAPASAPARRPT